MSTVLTSTSGLGNYFLSVVTDPSVRLRSVFNKILPVPPAARPFSSQLRTESVMYVLYTDSLAYKSIEVTLLLLMDCSSARKQAGKASQLVHQSTARQRDLWAGVVRRATVGLPVQECGSHVPI